MTTIDRVRTNFSGNERVDLPDFMSMLQNAYDDMRRMIMLLTDDEAQRVVKAYQLGTSSGLNLVVRTDVQRGFYDSTQEWVVKTPDPSGATVSVPLSPSATNYVQVAVNKFNDNPQPRAFWDVDIGLTGEEFFDTIDIRTQVSEGLSANTSGFDAGSVPLWLVVTNSTGIVSITPAQDILWEPRTTALPGVAARASAYQTIGDLRGFIDFLGALIGEVKGTGQLLESAPWSTLKLLREYQGLFITSSPTVTFEGTFGSNMLNWTGDLLFDIAGRAGGQYTLPQMTVEIMDGQALYVAIPEGAPPQTLTPIVVNIGSVPISPLATGNSPTIYTLFMRRGSIVYGAMDLAPLDSGESDVVGQDLPVALRTRLGLTSETTFEAYSSTHIIAAGDTYPEAISKLDNEQYAIQTNIPEEAYWTGDGSTTTFDMSTATLSNAAFSWLTDNTKVDVIVTVDGRGQQQDYTGGTGKSFRKLTTTSLEFTRAPDTGSIIKARKEGTSYGGAAAPTSGNLWSDPVDHDIVGPDLAYDLGSPTQRFANAYVETVYAQNLVLAETVGDIEPVKSKVNGSGATIAAGAPVALYTDGSIYPADANTPTGQRFYGIAAANIAPGMPGLVALFGMNVPGILTGLGFTPGDTIYVDNNGNYSNGTNLDNTSDYQRVGWADCPAGAASTTVTDLVANYQKIDQNTPQEEVITTVEGQTAYNFSTLVLDADNDVLDVQLWYDTGYQRLDGTGAEGFMKTSTTSIQLAEAPSISGKEMVFRKEGIVISPESGGGPDFANIPVAPTPDAGNAGVLDIGTLARPWSGIVMKDQVTNQVWRFSINSGAIQAVQIGTLP